MAASAVQPDEVTAETSIPRRARRLLIHAVLLGALADAALRNADGGLGWTIFIIGLACAAIIFAAQNGDRLTREQSVWLLLAVIPAMTVAWRHAEALQVANVLATLIALALFAMSAARAPAVSIFVARLRDVVHAFVYAARDAVAGAFALLFTEARLGSLIQASAIARRPALRAVLLTMPIVVVFTALLSRADPVFGSLFALPAVDVGRIMSHVVMAGVFAWLSAGLLRGALLGTATRPALPVNFPVRLGAIEITVSLGALAALFATFVGLQLRWLFGGAELVLATTGLTLAEYARRGFFELVMVAALVPPVILGTRAAAADQASVRRHSQLSLIVLVLIAAIVLSAMLRMRLYVTHFGLTTDRLYASALMIWIAFVLVAMSATVLRGRERRFAAMSVLSAFVTLLALNAANPEAIVARVNLSRSDASRAVDYSYLIRLNGDAAPVVAAALAGAEESREACNAALILRSRWLDRQRTRSNWGEMTGRERVLARLTPSDVQRLCGTAAVPAPDP